MEFFASNLKELFESTGEGLFQELADSSYGELTECRNIKIIDALDIEDLLVCWLRELLYYHQVEGLLLKQFRILTLETKRLTATVCGKRFDEKRDSIKHEIKAATYHDLEVKKTGDRWKARVIFDV